MLDYKKEGVQLALMILVITGLISLVFYYTEPVIAK